MALFERVAQKLDKQGEGSLTPSESAVLHIYELEAEVNNGGFDQYFFNSDGDGANMALAGLELLGAGKAADILRRAMASFGEEGPDPDREQRWQQIDSWDEPTKKRLRGLDDEFCAYPDPLAEIIAAHLRANPSQFADQPRG